ncbi:MAG: hypothetical protein C0402_07045 [Thermodesulfovibrio sp.]|nr:hypothetical protein [Thermodesulfovibrio sp.]
MKTLIAALIVSIVLWTTGGFAADKETKSLARDKKETPGSLINYQPRPGSIGKPAIRVGGATRGAEESAFVITALAPDHLGLTVSAQPSLCWYLSGRARTRLGITINDETSAAPFFEKEFEGNSDTGIRCIDLAAHGLSLVPGVEYQWFAAVIKDPEQRSKDIVSSGMIRRITPARELTDRLLSAKNDLEKAGIYASEGIWYDALSLLHTLIAANPDDKALRASRAGLLDQAGLRDAAAFDRK